MAETPTEGRVQRPRGLPRPLRVVLVSGAAMALWWAVNELSAGGYGGLPRVGTHLVNAVVLGVLGVALVAAAARFADRRPWGELRAAVGGDRGWAFTVGAVSWLVPAAGAAALCLGAGWVALDVRSGAAELLGAAALLVVTVLLLEALPEELIFREYLYRNLGEALPRWAAVVGQAALFTVFGTALWVAAEGWSVLAERGLLFLGMGVVLGCVRAVTGSVWACVGYHLVFQVSAQLVIGGAYTDITVHGAETFQALVFGAPFVLGPAIAAVTAHRRRPSPG
ncbi:CPBP family intramembrane glutamic endopeptidase [Nocardiopsis trehalosi]|jgi:membrane protease YdiL (CAAX protease family)|uniref:CPBP family intramembrane glutamic endopeptidase n=1 Tax=Nocardiopsis trehalosi TaxID=109329 RepID=UPI00083550F7|nr:CPBP family intramembrane glutamic endopeptidase [Nocardiopsis trehalosi]